MIGTCGTGTTRIRLLPVFDLIRDGERLCPPVRARRLIVLLAVHDGPVERSTAAELLWPDVVTSRACASLRATVWGLTRSAWSPVLVTADSLMLDPAVGCDLRDARAAATAIIDGCAGRADRDTVQLLSADLLPGASDEWLDDERRRFRQLRLHALDTLCRSQADAGRFAQAVLAGLAGVSSDPLRESAHRALMYAHLREGNPSEAIRQYHRYCRIVRDELGIGASTRMQQLLLEALDDAAETFPPLSGAEDKGDCKGSLKMTLTCENRDHCARFHVGVEREPSMDARRVSSPPNVGRDIWLEPAVGYVFNVDQIKADQRVQDGVWSLPVPRVEGV